MHSVIKLCADHLRAIASNQGIKLKSGHAHELAVAFFGYKSKAAMLADTLSPESNFSQVKTLVLMPSSFIAERQRCLDGLSANLLDIYTLGEEMFVKLISEGNFSFRSFASWAHLTAVLATEYLQKRGDLILPSKVRLYEKFSDFFKKPLYEFNPQIETTNSGVGLIVSNKYQAPNNVRLQGSIEIKFAIKLQRIAGYVGYSNAEVTVIYGSIKSFGQAGVTL